MIFIIIGGIGSGKTLSIIKNIVEEPKVKAFVNFNVKLKNCHRLLLKDIMTEKESYSPGGQPAKKPEYRVNWEFWNQFKKDSFSIYLDEVHNLVNSRRSMSPRNVILSNWVSQIRKILGDSTHSHLFLITQTIKKIDVNFRDLAHCIIKCDKIESKGKVWIKQSFYTTEDNYLMGKSFMKKVFLANPYFRYYDTHEMINFGDEDDGLL